MTNIFKGEFAVVSWAIALVLSTAGTPGSAQTIGMVIDGFVDSSGNPTQSGVHVFDADTREVLASFPTTADTGDCSISADGSTGYFTRTNGLNSTFNEVQIVDLTIPMLGPVIEVPTAPAQDTALSADGGFLVICDRAGTAKPITVVDTAAGPPAIASTFQPTDLSGVTSCTAVAVCDNNDVLITTAGAIPDVQRLRLDEFGTLHEYGPDRYTGLLGSDVPQDVLCGPGGTTAVVVLQNFFAPEVLSFTTNPLTLADSRALLDRGIAPDVPPGPALVGGASAMNAAGDRVYVRSWLNWFVDPSSCSAPLTGDPTVEACGLIQVHSFSAASGLFGDLAPDEDVIGPIRIETQGFGIDSIAVHPDGTRLFVSEHAGFDPLTFRPTDALASVNVYNTADGSLIGPLSDIADGATPSTAIEAPTGICFGPVGDGGGPLAFAAYDGSVQILLLDGDLNDTVFLNTTLTLGVGNDGFDLDEEELTIQVEGVSVTIDADSFVRKTTKKKDFFKFDGVIDGVTVELKIDILGGDSYDFKGSLAGVTLDSTDPVDVTLTIGDDGGTFEAFVLFI